MAIIFNISEAIKSSEFNVLGLSIPMLLTQEIEAFEKGSKISSLFVNKTLSGYSQSYHTSVTHGGFRPSEDMEIAKLHDWEDSYGKTFTAQTWKDSFAISQEAMEDGKDLEIDKKVREFSTNYARTREQYCASTVSGALTGSHTYGGKKFAVKAIDTVDGEIDGVKQKYFHKHHLTSVKVANSDDFIEMNGYEPWTVSEAEAAATGLERGAVYATKPQSNKFLVIGGGGTKHDAKGVNLLKVNPAAGDSAANIAVYDQIRFLLDTIREQGARHRNYDGKLVPLNYSRIIMPSNAKLRKAIHAALGGSITEGPFEGPMKGDQYDVVEWPYLNDLPGFKPKEFGLLIVDPERNARELGFILWDRLPLTVKSYLQDGNDTMVWYGRARFKTDTSDPYSVVYLALGDLANLSAEAYSGTTTTKYTSGTSTAASNATFIDLTDFEVYDAPTLATAAATAE